MESRYQVKNPDKNVVKSLHESVQGPRVYGSMKGTQTTQDKLFLMNPQDLAAERKMVAPGNASLSSQLFKFGE